MNTKALDIRIAIIHTPISGNGAVGPDLKIMSKEMAIEISKKYIDEVGSDIPDGMACTPILASKIVGAVRNDTPEDLILRAVDECGGWVLFNAKCAEMYNNTKVD